MTFDRQPEICTDLALAALIEAFPAEADVSPSDRRVRQAIHRAHLGRDFYTQAPLPIEDMSLDHLIPLSKGGRDNLYNLVPTSSSLNRLKDNKLDPVAVVPMLGILRLHFAPQALALLQAGDGEPPADPAEEASRPPPTIGTPESAAWFRGQLEALGMTQRGFARWLRGRGDDRSPAAIERHVRRMASGEARVSGEMRVILAMMRDGKRKALKRQAEAGAARQETHMAGETA